MNFAKNSQNQIITVVSMNAFNTYLNNLKTTLTPNLNQICPGSTCSNISYDSLERRLEFEGLEFTKDGYVDLSKYGIMDV